MYNDRIYMYIGWCHVLYAICLWTHLYRQNADTESTVVEKSLVYRIHKLVRSVPTISTKMEKKHIMMKRPSPMYVSINNTIQIKNYTLNGIIKSSLPLLDTVRCILFQI